MPADGGSKSIASAACMRDERDLLNLDDRCILAYAVDERTFVQLKHSSDARLSREQDPKRLLGPQVGRDQDEDAKTRLDVGFLFRRPVADVLILGDENPAALTKLME